MSCGSQSKLARLTPSVCSKLFGCGKKKKKSRSRARSKKSCGGKKKRRKSKKRKCGKKKKCRRGAVTNNPFFNFLRVFRQKHCGWPAAKIAIEGAKCWCKMNENDRKKFYKEACGKMKKRKKKKKKKKRSRSKGKCGSKRKKRRKKKKC